MSGIQMALIGAGGSPYTGTATVTVGFFSAGGFSSYGFDANFQGSITPTQWGGSGINVQILKFVNAGWVDFSVAGEVPNSGWTTLTIGSTTLNRVDGSYSTTTGKTTWIFTGGTNPFGTTVGATRAITWA